MDTPMCVPVGSKHVDGVLLVCCVCHALLGALRVKCLRTRAHCAWTHIQVRLRALLWHIEVCAHMNVSGIITCTWGLCVCMHVSMLRYAQMWRAFSEQVCLSAHLDAEGQFGCLRVQGQYGDMVVGKPCESMWRSASGTARGS